MIKKISDVRPGDVIIENNKIMVVRKVDGLVEVIGIKGHVYKHFILQVTVMQTEYDGPVPEILETRRATWDCGHKVTLETLEI